MADQTDQAAWMQSVNDRLTVLETQAPLESSSIGSGGIRVYDGGRIRFEGGNTSEDVVIGVINDSTQVRLGKTILYETNGVFQIWRYNAAGDAASARIMLTEDELTLFSNGRELHLGTGRASMRAFGKGFEITPTSIKIAGLPEGVASRMIALNASGDLISAPVPKGGGGTGPHPTGTWVWPFPLSATTSEFEPRWGRFHEGIDLGNAPALNGAQIRSAGPGTVQTAGYHSDDGFGCGGR